MQVPKGLSHSEQIAWRLQGILIRHSVRASKPIPPMPSRDQVAAELEILVKRQRSEIRVALIEELMSSQAAKEGLGLLMVKKAQEDVDTIKKLNDQIEVDEPSSLSEIERDGGDTSTWYPPKKP